MKYILQFALIGLNAAYLLFVAGLSFILHLGIISSCTWAPSEAH